MEDNAKTEGLAQTPTKGLWRRFLLLIPLLVVLVLGSRAYIRQRGATFVARGFSPSDAPAPDVGDIVLSEPGVVEVVASERDQLGFCHVTFHAVSDGEIWAKYGPGDDERWLLDVRDGTIMEGHVDFSGWESIHVSLCVFLAVVTMLFASALLRLWRSSWYGYTMVACGGGLMFCLFQLVLFLMLLLRGSLRDFSDLAIEMTSAMDYFVVLSLLPFGVLALLVSASNVSLIRHEGMRPVNLLGILASLAWAAANFFWLNSRELFLGVFESFELWLFADMLIATAITFGECLLLSTMLCAWLASRHVPSHGVDYLVVLGCGIRADGTPSPLLAGRVDKALQFDRERVAAGDPPATFVPSGGQGPDEVMSEARSMGNYLAQKGVPPERIVLEDRSVRTSENMAFSREVVERHAGRDVSGIRVGFSTTNYHVFRGYVCAHQAGMACEGMGSRTRAYFWPNAFLREFAGLLAHQWKTILQVYAMLAAIYLIAAYCVLFG